MKTILNEFLNLIFPGNRCVICGRSADKTNGLCEECRSGIVPICDNFCPKCGKPMIQTSRSGCRYCSHGGHLFTAARAAGVYTGRLKRAVIALKYYNRKGVAVLLGDMMYDVLKKTGFEIQAIVPVPLSKNRYNSRGYNQAELLAKQVARLSGIQMENGLVRVRDTASQTGLSRTERLHNLDGAFRLTHSARFKDKSVLLVDDTMTTGATADECARILLSSGARCVYLLTAATAVFD